MTSNQYKTTYDRLFNQLPKWKQLAVKEDSDRDYWSGILTDFVKNVIDTAEKEYEQNKVKLTEEVISPNVEKGKKTSKKKLKNKNI